MAFSYDEPIRYNEGKVDWTLLPWNGDLLEKLSWELKDIANNTSRENDVDDIFVSLFDKDIFHVLCYSLLASQQSSYLPKSNRTSELPWNALEQVCRVFMYAIETKYPRDNYKLTPGLPLESYIQSMWRHLVEYLRGMELDEESKLPHLSHLACNAFMYLWTQKTYHEPNTEYTSIQE